MPMRLVLDKSIYPLEVVEKASYRFIDRLTVLISQTEDAIVCEIESTNSSGEPDERHVADLKRELLDQKLRSQIKAETEPVRNLILSLAFSRSGLQK